MYVIKALLSRKLSALGLFIISVIILAAIFAPLITPYPPELQLFEGLTLEGAPLPPNAQFWLGTDLLGRDLFSRLVYGAQTSLIIGVIANGAAITIGTVVGIIAGFYRGIVGAILMRFTDLMMAFPALLLAIVRHSSF